MRKKIFYRNNFFGIATSERNQINERIELNNENYLETNDSDNIVRHRGVNRRVEINRIEQPLEVRINSRRMILELLCFVLMPILICIFYFPPRPLSVHWYPEASNTLDTMLIHKEHVNSYLNENILLIEDLKNHLSVYRDKVTKEHVKELLNSFAKANNLAKMDMQSLYRNANTISSTLSKTIRRIETKAKKYSKDEEFTEILNKLDNVVSDHDNLIKDILILLANQRNLLPIMRKSLKEIQDLIHNGLFVQVIPIRAKSKFSC
jgi:hypothetical protein